MCFSKINLFPEGVRKNDRVWKFPLPQEFDDFEKKKIELMCIIIARQFDLFFRRTMYVSLQKNCNFYDGEGVHFG